MSTSKVRVYGKAQNRTALGIMHAYLVMYPHATLEDLKKAFPDSLNPDSGPKINFIDYDEYKKKLEANPDGWKGFFVEEDCLLNLQNGKKVAVISMWTKPSFERLVAHASQYGIDVAKFEEAEKGIGKKGGYRLEYLNGYVPPVVKKGLPKWIWAVVAALVLLILFLLLGRKSPEPEVVTIVQKDTVTVIKKDTVYIQQFEEIEKNFNAAEFKVNSFELSEDAKFVLHDLAKLLDQHKDVKLRIVGHTSSDGDAKFNQELSEKRAKAAVDFLLSRGIAQERLSYEGKGSSEPVDPEHPEKNRRTEFIVLD